MVKVLGSVCYAQCGALIAAFEELASGPQARRHGHRVEVYGGSFRWHEVHPVLTALRRQAREVTEGEYVNLTLLARMDPGDSHVMHADNVMLDGRTPNHTPWRTHTAMVYLNRRAPEWGGELVLPGVGLRYTPRTGTMVAMPAGHAYRHEVTEVKEGSRYTVAIWMTDDPKHEETWDAD